MTPEVIDRACAGWQLEILGGFHPDADDPDLGGLGTLLLLGPREPGFWENFTRQPEYGDGRANPLDRWSARAITALAAALGGHGYFPFGGPPHLPFFTWALKTGRCHASPVQLLVHDRAGLFVSFRGALGLAQRIALPPAPPNPCQSCPDQPCRAACPVGALVPGGYDTEGCKAFLQRPAGKPCLSGGCAVRRACPVSRSYGRVAAQSAFHMQAFLPDDT